ncbi:hypothetical protein BS50DRAFT_643716 [Corynespora cassiicola Philippines]|uniref:Tat pathway signal sequence protein n=1 Tax=Corynespora cassiicola Philippines TaxID=1448308 RepID=A0A2T2PBS3_CORCC|nr:hypothetical protein BS50DRAFT_643716 [Corynespora cassiicola Philippines]
MMEMDPERFAEGNPFVGDPRLELDEAWNNLLRNIQISVKPYEFDLLQPQLNRSSLRLPEGSYVIRLKVFHKLHCLKWIRKWIHRDHYWPDVSGYELYERRWHIEHCLESLRLDTMCRPSLAPATFHFVDRNASDDLTANGDHVENCADWDTLQRWADQRRVDLNAIDRLSLKEGD